MADFSYNSKYNKEANFSLVKFGADAPLLETELNELQEIQNGRLKDFIKNLTGDSILSLGSITHSGSTVTITNTIFAINGNVVSVPNATVTANVGNNVYINVTESEVTYNDVIKNSTGVTIPNEILDSRIQQETSRRMVVKFALATTETVGTSVLIGTVTSSGVFTTSLSVTSLAGENIKLNGIAEGATKVEDSTTNGNIKINGSENVVYAHPTSGVTAGTFRSVTVNTQGHVTGGTNPTTLSGYGITDATPSSHIGSTGASHGVATTSVNGFMASTDKTKLDGVSTGANKTTASATNGNVKVDGNEVAVYSHPTSGVTAGTFRSVTVNTQGHVTGGTNPTSISGYGITDAYTKSEVDNKFSTMETNMDWKKSVASFSDIATTYPTPEDGWTVNVDDTDITYRYNGTAWIGISANTIPKVTTSIDGLMLSTDKTKLDGIATGANNYVHPANHAPSIISQDASNRFVTDTEKSTWNAKAGTAVATTSANGLMASADKTKLDGVATNANNYTHPASGVVAGTFKSVTVDNYGHVTGGSNPTTLAGFGITDATPSSHVGSTGSAHGVVTTSVNGFMSSADKTKLDGVATGANNYTHPASGVSASVYTSVAVDTNGHVTAGSNPTTLAGYGITDATPSSHIGANGTAHSVVSTTKDGFMSATDKVKLDGIATGANKVTTSTTNGNIMVNGTETNVYRLPASLSPSIIAQDINNSFVTEEQITTWDNKANKTIANNYSLTTGSWVGDSAPFTYTLSVTGATASNNIEILPQSTITADQVKAIIDAIIVTGTQTTNSITLKAFGYKPTIALPITILIRGDV